MTPCRLVLLLASAAHIALAQGNPKSCGVERWPVKVAIDADTARIDRTPHRAIVAELAALPNPTSLPQRERVAPWELRTFRVVAVVREIKHEDDGDIHVILEDIEDTSRTIVAEVPDSACALGSSRINEFANAYRGIVAAPPRAIVVLDGIGFFDLLHGQTGAAANGFELHPVVGVRVVGQAMGTAVAPPPRRSAGAAVTATGSDTRVWVNTSSHVYHCPGSRYYGVTKRGFYTTEREAIAAGARPAYGRRCVG